MANTATDNQSTGAWPQLSSGPLIAGGVLIGIGAVVALVGASWYLLVNVRDSKTGRAFFAVRGSEMAAVSLGIDVTRYKLLAFILSAGLSGLAGSVKSLVFQLASLTDVQWTMSGEVVLMTLVGGLGTIFGPVVGSLVVTAMENYLAQFGQWVTVTQGAIFVICVLAFRRGLFGELSRILKRPL